MTWHGLTVAVCGSGPSLTEEVAAQVMSLGIPILVTNDTWRRVPTAAVLFAANANWWKRKGPSVDLFNGERICSQPGVKGVSYLEPRPIPIGGNSALRACHLAEDRGASCILLYGVDLREDQLTHWHGLHQGCDNPNWTTFKRAATAWEAYARQPGRPHIINCNPQSRLQCFPFEGNSENCEFYSAQVKPKPVLFCGMHGIGDSIHERAVVRELLRHGEVWLRTSWPQLYWDLMGLHMLPLQSSIHWMAANEVRCASLYGTSQPPPDARQVRAAYPWAEAKATSVLGALSKYCGVNVGDFRLPIHPDWAAQADDILECLDPQKPLLITRPLMQVVEARSPRSAKAKLARNPDPRAYALLFKQMRLRYFVVSVADAQPGVEWAMNRLEVDAEFHAGELPIEVLAALVARASLVYCSPCFLTVLAQAVGTPQVCVFGGFEGANSFAPGARFTPWLPIEPIKACRCWNWNCRHDKTIDLAKALTQLELFLEDIHAGAADPQYAQEPAAAALQSAAD